MLASAGQAAGEAPDAYPLSPLQTGMLYHSMIDARGYLVQRVYRIGTAVDAERMRAAWQQAVDRHPALRTTFLWEGVPQPLQVVHDGTTAEFAVADWRDAPEQDRPRAWPG